MHFSFQNKTVQFEVWIKAPARPLNSSNPGEVRLKIFGVVASFFFLHLEDCTEQGVLCGF